MNRGNVVLSCLIMFILSACGNTVEEDKELQRKEDLQEISLKMNNSLNVLDNLKTELHDSLADYSGQEDSLSQLKADKYRLLISELEQAEESYHDWQQEITFEPSGMRHEETLRFYDEEEDKAQLLRQNMREALEFVGNEIEK